MIVMRFTENRKSVFNVIDRAEKPLSVEDIKARIQKKLDTSTVYRALEFLEKRGLIASVSFGGNIRFFFRKERFRHFLFCERCNGIEVFDKCGAKPLMEAVKKEYNFRINSHVFYFSGICSNCIEKEGE